MSATTGPGPESQMHRAPAAGPLPLSDPPLPRTLSSRIAYAGTLITMRVDEIEMVDTGRAAVREVVEHPGAVVIVALDATGSVYLVRQYRHAIGQYLLELPAGGLEPGEEPLAAARRELREEVGLQAGAWRELGAFCSSPGFANEWLHAFLAEDLTTAEREPDDDEDISVIRYPLGDLLANLGQVPDAKTLATLCLLQAAARTIG